MYVYNTVSCTQTYKHALTLWGKLYHSVGLRVKGRQSFQEDQVVSNAHLPRTPEDYNFMFRYVSIFTYQYKHRYSDIIG